MAAVVVRLCCWGPALRFLTLDPRREAGQALLPVPKWWDLMVLLVVSSFWNSERSVIWGERG